MAYEVAGKAVLALLKSGKIGPAEAASAERYYHDYALGIHGVFDSEVSSSGGGDAHTAGFARAKAAQAYRAANEAVGSFGRDALHRMVIDGLSVEAVSRHLAMHHTTAAGVAIAVLLRLSEHYAVESPSGAPSSIRRADFSA